MQVFLRVVESRSFVRAAQTLALPASSVTAIIKRLEKHLQTRLLNRSTRNLSLTPEGERYFHRCREILDLIADTEASLQGASDRPQGRLRVDILAALPCRDPAQLANPAAYPDIYDYRVNDRQVDLIQGAIADPPGSLELDPVARPLGELRWSPARAATWPNTVLPNLEDLRDTGRSITFPLRGAAGSAFIETASVPSSPHVPSRDGSYTSGPAAMA